jgi:hypothetical protein
MHHNLQENLIIKAREKVGENIDKPGHCVRKTDSSGIFGGIFGRGGCQRCWVLIIAVGGVIAVFIILVCVLFKLVFKKKKPSSKKKKPIPTIQMSLIAQCDNDFEMVQGRNSPIVA